jgi:hypothetical protein
LRHHFKRLNALQLLTELATFLQYSCCSLLVLKKTIDP